MNRIPYTWCPLRYTHDPVVGEVLNIGVLVYAPAAGFLGVRFDDRYARLSCAFSGFDADHFRRVVNRFYAALARVNDHLSGTLLQVGQRPEDAGGIVRLIWPDQGLSFRTGETAAGLTEDPEATLGELFVRLVSSQHDHAEAPRRSDPDVWAKVYRQPIQAALGRVAQQNPLRAKKVEALGVQVKFEHAFQNGCWHALQPLSLDMMRSEDIGKKAARWFGYGYALAQAHELSKVYFLLGKPSNPEYMSDYRQAVALLDNVAVEHELIEEEHAEAFAERIAEKIQLILAEHSDEDELGPVSK